MHKVSMMARKAMTYGTRSLRAGSEFQASRQDAAVLVAVGLAHRVPATVPGNYGPGRTNVCFGDLGHQNIATQPAPVVPPISETELSQLRHEYETKTGRKPDSRWRVARLRAEIEVLP